MSRFQVLAVNDKASFCECCGRSNLKVVVWILDHETGEHKHFGTSCALQPVKGFDCSEEIKIAIKTRKAAEKLAISRAHRLYRSQGGTYVRDTSVDYAASIVVNKPLWENILNAEMGCINA